MAQYQACEAAREVVGGYGMSKPRIYGSISRYTPNNRMDARKKKKVYQHRRQIAEQDMQEIRDRKELRQLEQMKMEAMKQ